MRLAGDYAAAGIGLRRSLPLLGMPRRSFYSRPVLSPKRGGRRPSIFTAMSNDSTIEYVTNVELVPKIKQTLSMEFVCYGYKKMTFHLHWPGYMVNAAQFFLKWQYCKRNGLQSITRRLNTECI